MEQSRMDKLSAGGIDVQEALDRLMGNLQSYRDVLASGDRQALADKLAFSAARKRQMDLPGPDLLA